MHDLRTSVYQHLQRLSLAFFTRTRTGDVQSRIANDIGGIDTVVTSTATSVLSNVTTVIATIVAMILLDWRLALFALILLPLFVWLTKRVGDAAQEGDGRASGLARGRLLDRAGVALGLGDPARQDDGPLRRPRRAVLGRVAAPGRPRGAEPDDRPLDDGRDPDDVRGDAGARLLVRGLVAGARHRGRSRSARSSRSRPCRRGCSSRSAACSASRSRCRARWRCSTASSTTSTSRSTSSRAPRTLEQPRGDVAFDRVCFRYDDDAWTLKDVSFSVPAGTKTALVGETGSGKTTCGYLVARLYDATEGTVSIDGIDVRELTFESLAAAVGVVSQETYLFHSTVRENLRFAKPDATDEEVEEAARAAQIHELIASLPDGYETVVGERGYRFSGGEKQRMAIARTVLRNPPILVLDEATSALDTQTERLVQEALERLCRGADDDRDRAPPLDGPGRGADRRPRPGARRRDGHARGAARRRRPLRACSWRGTRTSSRSPRARSPESPDAREPVGRRIVRVGLDMNVRGNTSARGVRLRSDSDVLEALTMTTTPTRVHGRASRHGLDAVGTVVWSPTTAQLYTAALKSGDGALAHGGPLVVDTGKFTGRSPKDKFVVAEPGSEDRIWWGEINHPLPRTGSTACGRRSSSTSTAQDPLYVVDAFAGADPAHRIGVRVHHGEPLPRAVREDDVHHALRRRGVRRSVPTSSSCTRPRSRPTRRRTAPAPARSSSSTRREGEVLVGGTFYAGEIKKAIFTVMNDRLPLEGVLPMHCSANVGEDGKVAIFFGLSGTGKTTLSADPERSLIGDDEHGWGSNGVFNIEGGCYAKVIRLSARGRAGDLPDDADLRHGARERRRRRARRDRPRRRLEDREHARRLQARADLERAARRRWRAIPSSVVMLTADAFGILPPIARLLARPGALLLPLRLHGQARRHRDRRAGAAADVLDLLRRARSCRSRPPSTRGCSARSSTGTAPTVWLVNTGWTGGPYGEGHRMPIQATRRLLHAALSRRARRRRLPHRRCLRLRASPSTSRASTRRCSIRARPGATPRPTTRRPASSPRCSPRTSRSSPRRPERLWRRPVLAPRGLMWVRSTSGCGPAHGGSRPPSPSSRPPALTTVSSDALLGAEPPQPHS